MSKNSKLEFWMWNQIKSKECEIGCIKKTGMCRIQWRRSFFRSEIPFLWKFGLKNENCQFKLKSSTKATLKVQNSMVTFSFLDFQGKQTFWAYFVREFKVLCFKRTIESRLIRFCRIHASSLVVFAFNRKYSDWENFFR